MYFSFHFNSKLKKLDISNWKSSPERILQHVGKSLTTLEMNHTTRLSVDSLIIHISRFCQSLERLSWEHAECITENQMRILITGRSETLLTLPYHPPGIHQTLREVSIRHSRRVDVSALGILARKSQAEILDARDIQILLRWGQMPHLALQMSTEMIVGSHWRCLRWGQPGVVLSVPNENYWKKCSQLRELHLWGVEIDNRFAEIINSLPNLEILTLEIPSLTDEQVVNFATKIHSSFQLTLRMSEILWHSLKSTTQEVLAKAITVVQFNKEE